ncbi:MAG TPA: hypothetical protein QF761_04710, partial [Pirellulales bacterium]|nr:hypothetical protein [Pirellulales bacterium]
QAYLFAPAEIVAWWLAFWRRWIHISILSEERHRWQFCTFSPTYSDKKQWRRVGDSFAGSFALFIDKTLFHGRFHFTLLGAVHQ